MTEMGLRPRVFARPLNLGAGPIPRGEFLTDREIEVLERSPNRQALKDSFLRYETPPAGLEPKLRVAPPVASKPITWPEPEPWVAELAGRAVPGSWCWRLAEVIAASGLPLSAAIDRITARRLAAPHDVIAKATKEYAELPKVLSNGQRSGQGHWMRSVEGFQDYLRVLIGMLSKLKEAHDGPRTNRARTRKTARRESTDSQERGDRRDDNR